MIKYLHQIYDNVNWLTKTYFTYNTNNKIFICKQIHDVINDKYHYILINKTWKDKKFYKLKFLKSFCDKN